MLIRGSNKEPVKDIFYPKLVISRVNNEGLFELKFSEDMNL